MDDQVESTIESSPTHPTEELAAKVERLKMEVDGLQIAVTSAKKVWYKDLSTIISVLAFLFSFGTSVVAYNHTKAQDIQASRQELRGILQRLSAIPRENLDANKRYAGDPASQDGSSQMYAQENAMLGRQAAEIAKALPKKLVSATEYYEIAMSLQNSLNISGAKEYLDLSIANAKDFNDEISAVRSSANLEFLTGQPQSGRVKFEQALNIFEKYPNYNPYTVASTNIYTDLFWAEAEASINQFPLALPHIDAAEKLVDGLSISPGQEALRAKVYSERQLIQKGVPSAIPMPSP